MLVYGCFDLREETASRSAAASAHCWLAAAENRLSVMRLAVLQRQSVSVHERQRARALAVSVC